MRWSIFELEQDKITAKSAFSFRHASPPVAKHWSKLTSQQHLQGGKLNELNKKRFPSKYQINAHVLSGQRIHHVKELRRRLEKPLTLRCTWCWICHWLNRSPLRHQTRKRRKWARDGAHDGKRVWRGKIRYKDRWFGAFPEPRWSRNPETVLLWPIRGWSAETIKPQGYVNTINEERNFSDGSCFSYFKLQFIRLGCSRTA